MIESGLAMIVVSDASPLNVLIRLNCVDLLAELFGSVLIPTAVEAELTHPRTPVVHQLHDRSASIGRCATTGWPRLARDGALGEDYPK
jgi:predicted nucleic acid-binding protein